MRGRAGKFKYSSGLAPALLALVLLFRLLVPSGYMIAADRDGTPQLMLCAAPVQAPAKPAVDGDHEGHSADPAGPAPSNPGEQPCPFAALAAPHLPPEPPAVPERIFAAALRADLPPGPDFPRVAPASPPPPARGPPLPV
jgi:hypothetical protein